MSISSILTAFGLDNNTGTIQNFGTGLINNTWVVTDNKTQYILQRINHNVFKDPAAIAFNIDAIGNYLKEHSPEYLFTYPLPCTGGTNGLYKLEDGYYRMFHFVERTHSKDIIDTPEQAYEAATPFGRFTQKLNDFDTRSLKPTIPNFHNINLRYEQFKDALKNGNPDRIKETKKLIQKLLEYDDIVKTYQSITQNPSFKLRVTHHDTKISNVLFDQHDKGVCVIDLDTVMPGYFISDVGDMFRTYLSPVSEEETDFSKIEIRNDFYQAVVQGYFDEMKDSLTIFEKSYFFYAGKFLIYMQALRFLTDHLNNDIYYGAKYPGHNLSRAENQTVLLERLIQKSDQVLNII